MKHILTTPVCSRLKLFSRYILNLTLTTAVLISGFACNLSLAASSFKGLRPLKIIQLSLNILPANSSNSNNTHLDYLNEGGIGISPSHADSSFSAHLSGQTELRSAPGNWQHHISHGLIIGLTLLASGTAYYALFDTFYKYKAVRYAHDEDRHEIFLP